MQNEEGAKLLQPLNAESSCGPRKKTAWTRYAASGIWTQVHLQPADGAQHYAAANVELVVPWLLCA